MAKVSTRGMVDRVGVDECLSSKKRFEFVDRVRVHSFSHLHSTSRFFFIRANAAGTKMHENAHPQLNSHAPPFPPSEALGALR